MSATAEAAKVQAQLGPAILSTGGAAGRSSGCSLPSWKRGHHRARGGAGRPGTASGRACGAAVGHSALAAAVGLLGAAGASSPTQDTVASSLAVWWPIWRGWRWPTTMTAGIGAGPGRWAGCCDHTGWRGLSRMRDARWPDSDARSVTPNVTREQKPSKAAERDLS